MNNAMKTPSLAMTSLYKKDFVNYMNVWLHTNWANPYPGDDGLAEMAPDCGRSSIVVGNCLVNVRIRKWRPAIIKAYEIGRPAEMLREDAIAIFDGIQVRKS